MVKLIQAREQKMHQITSAEQLKLELITKFLPLSIRQILDNLSLESIQSLEEIRWKGKPYFLDFMNAKVWSIV